MRRKDREITDFSQMLKILESCPVCRLGLTENNEAYIIPLSFGYELQSGRLILYFHSACEGRKISLIQQQTARGQALTATFELDTAVQIQSGETACQFTCLYKSIMGKGTLTLLPSLEEKAHALQKIMAHYSGQESWSFQPQLLSSVAVLRLEVTQWSCKIHGV